MKAIQFLVLVVLNASSTLFRSVVCASWAMDYASYAGLDDVASEVKRAIDISKHVVANLAGDNYDATIQNFVQILLDQDPNGVGLDWVQDVFAGGGAENLPGIANFGYRIIEDFLQAGDLVSTPSF